MATRIRSIVSGKKARTSNGEHDLDLIHLTDRIIIMGWPAAGFEGMYRNQRKDVVKYLNTKYGDHYRVFNLCPRDENSYLASEFGGRVSRFPFPDHFAPPLSLLPIAVDRMTRWAQEDERNVIVIHCKAGKGRSGTIAVSYLLSLPGFPELPLGANSAPPLPEIDPEVPDVPGAMDAKLQYILKFHTSRRMKPGTTARGVSISSQQRFLQYFARTLSNRDPRPPPGSPIRLIKLEYIQINGPGMSGIAKSILGGKQIAVQLRRYKDSIATKLRDWEVALKSTPTEGRAAAPDFNDDDWDDQVDMLVRSADLVEHIGSEEGAEEATSRKLYPAATYYPPSTTDRPPLDGDSAKAEAQRDGGILLDADREVQFRFLVGETGRKHSKLHPMGSLAIAWLVPSFESAQSAGELCRLTLDPAKELDFYKPQWGVDSVEIAWRWM